MRNGGEKRGNAGNRRARKHWLLSYFGTGTVCQCWECSTLLTIETIHVDRIQPGGSYRRDNIRPHCPTCSHKQGYRMGILGMTG